MRKITTLGHIKDGKLFIHKRKEFDGIIADMPDCYIILEVRKKYKQRTDRQNRYYWGVIVELWRQTILEEWGDNMTDNEVHEFLKLTFNFEERVCERTGEVLKVPKSTTKNTTTDMEEYHERCRRAAAEMFRVVIPLPEEQTEIEF